ncbi:CPBP family intramembrane glutamic endopeptidase [Saliphagus infecundisoli]|uniref:CPBP family intramembrane glutamic endopeptidase n=1 Tax=Saliphagus infecundisoli TaxID=1849069 RepID=A0ABD5QI73_9EURY|nr:type II CAAX endopeptidase family protein [Saliphagus infecundisoli]
MTERVESAGGVGSDRVVPAVGTVLAGLALVGLLSPVTRSGVDALAVFAAAGLAAAAVGAFVLRRHGAIGKRPAGIVAAAASLGALLLAGYALNRGLVGPVGFGPVSVPTVVVAVLAAGGALALGVAEAVGLGDREVLTRTRLAMGLGVVGAVGLLAAYAATFVVAVPAIVVLGTFSQTEEIVLSQLGMAVGTGAVAVAYLRLTDRPLSFLDVRVPSLRDVGWTVGGLVALVAVLLAISALMSVVGAEQSTHSTAEAAAENPEILLVLIPAAVLVIGPFEELLYRNVIQKSLYGEFSRAGSVVVGSVLFAVVHVISYNTATVGAVIASLAVVFGLSIVLGALYERTENLVVPALVHGLYNAIVFANLYVTYA